MDFWEKIIISLFIVLMVPITVALSFSLYKNITPNENLKTASLYGVFHKKNTGIGTTISNNIQNTNINNSNTLKAEKLANPPEIINAIYVTSWSAGSKKYVDEYLPQLFKNTEINAVVIDIKDYSGYVSYLSGSLEVIKYKTAKNIISDLPSLIKKLHEKNIYVIARVSVFEDPVFANARPDLAVYDASKTVDKKNPVLWQDNNGLNWLDSASTEVWDYNISIAKDAILNGFDEINFDYIRFPSDGKMANIAFPYWDQKTPRHLVIKNFFERIRQQLPNAKLSVDLFGQSTISFDDLGIGQIIEDSFEYFDYVCPMIYPSHYASNFMGFNNPAQYPYDVVKYSLDTANSRQLAYSKKLAKIRPWLQDFNMGAIYTVKMVKEQITATKEALGENYTGYMLWNPNNIYKQGAILKEPVKIENFQP